MSSLSLRLQPGDAFGPFRVLAELGRGATGAVWRVRDAAGRELALKVLLKPESPMALARFQREGEITAGLNHPGIVRVHHSGVVDGWPFLAYELAGGETLEDRAARSGRGPLARLVLQAARAVGYAHQRGVLHRDLKPANVLVDAQGVARVADFGAASGAGLERLTQSGALVGTPHFMAPEQLTGKREAWGPPADVWALGVTLYWALTRRLPFEAENLVALSGRVLGGAPTPPRQHDAGISPALEAVCLRALEVEPRARYADADAFADDLEAALGGGRVRAARRSGRGVALTLGALLLMGAGGWIGWRGGAAPARDAPADAGTPADARAERALARRRALLETTLAELPDLAARARLAGGDFALLSGDPTAQAELRAAYDARLAAFVRACGQATSQAELLEVLRDLQAIAAAAAEPLRPGAPALNGFLRWVYARIRDARELPVDALEAAAALGGRVSDRAAALNVVEGGAALHTVEGLPREDWGRACVAMARLDLTFGPRFSKSDYTQYAARGDSLWESYTRLMLAPESGETRAQLLVLIQDPPPGLELGPMQWAAAACSAALALEGQARIDLLEEAFARDPESPAVSLRLATEYRYLRRHEEALEAARRSFALHQAEGYHQRISTRQDWVDVNFERVMALAAVGERQQAREAYRSLALLSSDPAEIAARYYPWLKE